MLRNYVVAFSALYIGQRRGVSNATTSLASSHGESCLATRLLVLLLVEFGVKVDIEAENRCCRRVVGGRCDVDRRMALLGPKFAIVAAAPAHD